jgi:release factor glutamine methyltransferase
MKISAALIFIKNQLFPLAGESALSEAEMILQHVLNCSRSELYLQNNYLIPKELQDTIDQILQRRKRNEPLPYIFEKAYFHSKEFFVNKDVLIPRPDTEIIVETVLDSEIKTICRFLEIGIGSGAVSSILLREHPEWKCVGTDISFSALHVAQKNCPGNACLACIDLFSSIKPNGLFDFIVSNPPYISESEMAGLDTGVKDFEPTVALAGGKDGLDFYRVFASQAKHLLNPDGRLYCEIGYSQGDSAVGIFSDLGWKNIKIINDLAGRPRVVKCNL